MTVSVRRGVAEASETSFERPSGALSKSNIDFSANKYLN
jgi:hypothetical protein